MAKSSHWMFMSRWILRGLEVDGLRERRDHIISPALGREELHDVCALGFALVGKFGRAHAYRRFKKAVPGYVDADDLHARLAKLLEVSEEVVRRVDDEHRSGKSAKEIAETIQGFAGTLS